MRVVQTAAAVLAAGAGYEQVVALTQRVHLPSGGSRPNQAVGLATKVAR